MKLYYVDKFVLSVADVVLRRPNVEYEVTIIRGSCVTRDFCPTTYYIFNHVIYFIRKRLFEFRRTNFFRLIKRIKKFSILLVLLERFRFKILYLASVGGKALGIKPYLFELYFFTINVELIRYWPYECYEKIFTF